MRKQLADLWALQVIEQIDADRPFETAHVELKRESNEYDRLARQLAGAANAAQAEPILLLIGIDQSDGIVGVSPFEVGDWYAQIRARFEDGHAPDLSYPNFLRFKDKTIGVFIFETDNAPYVIGAGKRGSTREILWRYGSNTGTAGRRELLRMLLPQVTAPEIEVQKAEVRMGDATHASVSIELFIYPSRSLSELVVPFHRISLEISDGKEGQMAFPSPIRLLPRNAQSSSAKLTDNALVIQAPSYLAVHASTNEHSTLSSNVSTLNVLLTFKPAYFDSSVRVVASVARRQHPNYQGYWELEADHHKPLQTLEVTLKQFAAMAYTPPPSPFEPLPPPRGYR